MNYSDINKDVNEDILSKLENYCAGDYVPMHMPGVKRNVELFNMGNPYGIDITEIDGFDNLHHAEGVIAASMKNAAELFGADETLYLINGSSAGILSAICGATDRGDHVLIARNCHVSVYNAIYMNGLHPVYFQPKCDEKTGIYEGVTIEEIGHTLDRYDIAKKMKEAYETDDVDNKASDIKAVVITSPTYEGNVSEVKEIAEYLHERGIILIVDEAHGAHFNMSDAFPVSAVSCGADAVIQSIHKTLPSLTQTALLHLNGNLIDRERVKMYWNIYQTTSPSYVLMGGIDRCMSILRQQGTSLFADYVKMLKILRGRISGLNNIHLIETDDISKLVLEADFGGKQLYEKLRKDYHIQLEMASIRYVIAMTSIGDTKEYYDRFAAALEEIDEKAADTIASEVDGLNMHRADGMNQNEIQSENKNYKQFEGVAQTQIDMVMTPAQAVDMLYAEGGELMEIADSIGRISGAQVCMYPPGIPLVNPGERMTEEIIGILSIGLDTGLEVMGLKEGKVICLK